MTGTQTFSATTAIPYKRTSQSQSAETHASPTEEPADFRQHIEAAGSNPETQDPQFQAAKPTGMDDEVPATIKAAVALKDQAQPIPSQTPTPSLVFSPAVANYSSASLPGTHESLKVAQPAPKQGSRPERTVDPAVREVANADSPAAPPVQPSVANPSRELEPSVSPNPNATTPAMAKASSNSNSADLGGTPVIFDAPAKPAANDIAFALKVSTEVDARPATTSQDTAFIQGSGFATRTTEMAEPQRPDTNPGQNLPAPTVAAVVSAPERSGASVATERTQPATADVPEQVLEPARFLRVQIAGNDTHHVELRMVEQSGSVNVSVRSADPALARSLQEGMGELTGRLQAEHFKTETWIPKAPESSSSGNDSYSSSRRESAQQNQSGNAGSRNGKYKPAWVDELDKVSNSNTRRKS